MNLSKKLQRLILTSFGVLLLCSFNFSNPIALQNYKNSLNISREKLSLVGIAQTKDLIYPGAMGEMKYDLYYPVDYRKKKYPVFIWIHGGGFWAGNKSDPMDVAISRTIAELGYVVASIDYTLVVTGKADTAFPTAMRDVEKFIGFARKNLKDVNADLATPISIGGASAGAYLALYQATNPKNELPFRCVVDAFGPVDLTARNFNPTSMKIRNHSLTASGETIPSPQLMEQHSPLFKLSSFQGAIALILHSNKDTLVPIHQSQQLEVGLVNKGVSVFNNYIYSKSTNVGDADHDYPLDFLIENLQSFLSTEVCKNAFVSLSCSQNVKKGEAINCLTHLNANQVKNFHWVINGKKEDNRIAYSWTNITPGTYSAQIVAEDKQGQIHYSNFAQVEIK